MTMRRLTTVATLLAVIVAMGDRAANAQEPLTARIALPAGVLVATSGFITVTGVVNGTWDFTSSCMHDYGFDEDQPVVKVVNVDFIPRIYVLDSAVLESSLPAGTRLTEITLIGACSDGGINFNIYEGTIASPQNSATALAITPDGVSLTEEHEAVIGAGSDELGMAAGVCVKQGSQSIKTPIVSDIALEAGDRLTDFVEVDFDPETGETMYACRVEY